MREKFLLSLPHSPDPIKQKPPRSLSATAGVRATQHGLSRSVVAPIAPCPPPSTCCHHCSVTSHPPCGTTQTPYESIGAEMCSVCLCPCMPSPHAPAPARASRSPEAGWSGQTNEPEPRVSPAPRTHEDGDRVPGTFTSGGSGAHEASVVLPCGHVYHARCIADWLKVQNRQESCPNGHTLHPIHATSLSAARHWSVVALKTSQRFARSLCAFPPCQVPAVQDARALLWHRGSEAVGAAGRGRRQQRAGHRLCRNRPRFRFHQAGFPSCPLSPTQRHSLWVQLRIYHFLATSLTHVLHATFDHHASPRIRRV